MSECVICLSGLLTRDFIVLECGHLFHSDCATNLLKSSDLCPICRNPILKLIKPYFDFDLDFSPAKQPINHSLNLKLQFYQKEVQKYKTSHQDLAQKVEEVSYLLSAEQTKFLHLHSKTCKLEDELLLREKHHDLIITRMQTDFEAYKGSFEKKIEFLTSECQRYKSYAIASDICELVDENALSASAKEYVASKQTLSNSDLLQEISLWVTKGQALQNTNQALETENRKLKIELERVKKSNHIEKEDFCNLTVASTPISKAKAMPMLSAEKRAIEAFSDKSESSEKRPRHKEVKNMFFAGPTPNNSKYSNLSGKVSDGRGNFVKVSSYFK